MQIPAYLTMATGLSEEAIAAKAEEILADTSKPAFNEGSRRTIEFLTVAAEDGAQYEIQANYQFTGVHDGRAVFIRVGLSSEDREATAIETAVNALMGANIGGMVSGIDAADEADLAAELQRAADEGGK